MRPIILPLPWVMLGTGVGASSDSTALIAVKHFLLCLCALSVANSLGKTLAQFTTVSGSAFAPAESRPNFFPASSASAMAFFCLPASAISALVTTFGRMDVYSSPLGVVLYPLVDAY